MENSASSKNRSDIVKANLMLGVFFMFGIVGCFSNSLEDLKVLGDDGFSKEVWRDASQEERGRMVFSLLHKHDVTKMKVEEVQALLGESTAYYEYDEFPAYLVGPKDVESEYGKGYLLAFPFERTTGVVSKYVIYPEPKKMAQ
jgi:hypothetical protein